MSDARLYWWVSQGYNHAVAVEQGSLWSLPSKRRRLPDRELLKQMQVGDVVIHYDGPAVRAVSVVSRSWRDYPRPDGYSMREGEGNIGWLVEVDVRAAGLFLHRDRVAEIVEHGSPGPLDRNGRPRQIYVARLPQAEARQLLDELELDESALVPDVPMFGLSAADWAAMATDAKALGRIRLEQLALRRRLLAGRHIAPCAICHRELPARLLVAAHITPRRLLDDSERLRFDAIAMLLCTFGCDALFEWGYVVVGDDGRIASPAPADTPALEKRLRDLVGGTCTAHGPITSAAFRAHRELHAVTIT